MNPASRSTRKNEPVSLMLADLCIIPIGHETHTSGMLADVLKIVKESGLPYQLTPTSTCLEGSWTDVMAVVHRCHEAVRSESPHLVTMLRIEDDVDSDPMLARNVASVEAEAGEAFATSPEEAEAGRPLQRIVPPLANPVGAAPM